MARVKRKFSSQNVIAEQAAIYGVSLTNPSPNERFLSPNEIGRILNVSGEAVKQWIYHRRLPAVKLANGYWKVRVADFEAFWKARNEVGRRRVLVTCTQEDAMSDIVQAVDSLGHQAVTTSNYADALLKSFDQHPALFIINCNAGDLDPWKLAFKIRTTKALRSIPILLTAADVLKDADADRALELPAQGFIKRPATPELLAQEIGRILNRTL